MTVKIDKIAWERPYGLARRVSAELDRQTQLLAEKIAAAAGPPAKPLGGRRGRVAGSVAGVSTRGTKGRIQALREAASRTWT